MSATVTRQRQPHSTVEGASTVVLCDHATATVDGDRVRVEGELDALSSPALTAVVLSLPQPPAVIDCSAVTFIDAAGVESLLEAAHRHPFVTIASPAVSRLIAICRVTVSLQPLLESSPTRATPRCDRAPLVQAGVRSGSPG